MENNTWITYIVYINMVRPKKGTKDYGDKQDINKNRLVRWLLWPGRTVYSLTMMYIPDPSTTIEDA
jgi:hypothetical protein